MRKNISKKKKWPRQNLGELVSFLEMQYPEGLTIEAIAQRLGVTPQGVSNLFRKDDMKLSRAEEIAKIYGYKLVIYYPVRVYNDGYVPCTPIHSYPNAKNLSGLVKYIQDSEYYVSFVAEKSGMNPITLLNAFKKGDIQLSRLNAVLDTLGIWAKWTFVKN